MERGVVLPTSATTDLVPAAQPFLNTMNSCTSSSANQPGAPAIHC
jgi:hypothetical protein